MSLSPADLAAAYLTIMGKVQRPASSPTAAWPCYVGHLPSGDTEPQRAVAVFDTAGRKDCRQQRTGRVRVHNGFQIRVRHEGYNDGRDKIEELAAYLGTVHNITIANDGGYTKIHSISQRGTSLPMGYDETTRRHHWAMNFLCAVSLNSATSPKMIIWNEVPGGTQNGTNLVFTLDYAVFEEDIQLYVNGILQRLSIDYTLDENEITFVAGLAPASTDIVQATYWGIL